MSRYSRQGKRTKASQAKSGHPTRAQPVGVAMQLLVWLISAGLLAVCVWLAPRTLPTLNSWWRAQDYVATPATAFLRQEKQADGSVNSWPAYRYRVGEQTYVSDRRSAVFEESGDDEAIEALGKKLEAASRSQETIQVWVSPRHPEIAMLSRAFPSHDLTPNLLALLIGGMYALTGVLFGLRCLFKRPGLMQGGEALGLAAFGLLWCAIALTMFTLAWKSEDSVGWPRWVLGAFVGLGLLFAFSGLNGQLRGYRAGAAPRRPLFKIESGGD